MDEIKMEQTPLEIVEDGKKKPKGYCSENIEHLRDLLKQSETRFDDFSEILINIVNCENSEKSSDMNYKCLLDLLSEDLQSIKMKIISVESKILTLKQEFNNEQVSLKEENEEELTKTRINKTEYFEELYQEPKVEMEEYLDEDSFLDYQEDEEYTTTSKKSKRNTPKKYSKKQDFCDMCDKKVTNAAEHKRLFHKTGKFKCYLCNFNLSTLQKVKKHILESHEEDYIPYATQMGTQVDYFLCYNKSCTYECSDILDYKAHVKEQHEENIDSHSPKEKHTYGEMKCKFCDFMKLSLLELKKHMKQEHPTQLGGVKMAQRTIFSGENTIIYVTEVLNPDIKHYICMKSRCPMTSTNEDYMEKHAQIHQEVPGDCKEEVVDNSSEEFSCNKCTYVTRNSECYLDHINGDLKFRKCPFCDNHFSAQNKDFNSHLKKHGKCYDEKTKIWFCFVCCTKFRRHNAGVFISHLYKEHNIGTPYHCPKCEFSAGSIELCQRHTTIHNESAVPCPHCSYIAQSQARLGKHIYNTHQSFDCRNCDIKFKIKNEYLEHVKDHEEVDMSQDKSFCDHCGDFFSTHKELFLHKIDVRRRANPTKNSMGEFYCELCNTKFTRLRNLSKHMKNKHPSDDSGVMQCEEPGCAYKTMTKHCLQRHVEKVHLGIRWPCKECKFVGAYKGDLSRHMKIVHEVFEPNQEN